MANSRSFSASPASAATASVATATATATPLSGPGRGRLRAVAPDEVVQITDFLPPGATWLPAPQHTLPTLPGQPPMVGYLVLVPAGQEPVTAGPEPLHPAAGQGHGKEQTSAGPVWIDTVQRAAQVDGRQLDLTYLEFELLAHLVAHPHRVHTRDQLVTTVWGYGHVGDGRTVDVHIARLRRKLGAEHRRTIQTVRRVGYKYAPPTSR
ncbi:transcriptional regulator [Streptomyces longisporoflavus]|uniref:winged helix-turn-helix domain-containing protein n=1 Tax=Streptomyces longisporoflavus TaxID=28044 RepID=UPI00167EA8C9|nr:winged helix-turn-helix domain-containing protein [Streptomyces longisporoflavus]GGV38900.1 transcriptional regulator [Streptomyces longisporoflavus]